MVNSDSSNIVIDYEGFNPASFADSGFNIDLIGKEIVDAKGKKLGKVLASEKNMGIALVDLNRLN
jgi:ribosomal 30S subunit maturation factor RimM